MKVLHVITGLAAGGAEQQLRTLLPHMDCASEVAVLTAPGVLADAIRAGGSPVRVVGMDGNRDLRALPRLTALMRAGRYQVVHAHLFRACVYAPLAARLAAVPAVVATEHSAGARHIEGRAVTAPIRSLYRTATQLTHAVVAVSPTVADRLHAWGLPRSRVVTIPNGVDLSAFRHDPRAAGLARARLGIPPEAFVVGGLGRMVAGKNFHLLVEALPHLDGAVLLLVGDGPELPRLRLLAARLGVGRRVVLAGESAHVPELLSAMDVLAAPSQEETFGLAVVEALAAGLPVLYGSCPAIDDLPPGTAPGARRVPPHRLTAELAALLAGPRTRLPPPPGLDRYDVRRQARRLHDLYDRLLTRHHQERLT
ncbi:glycosyltransferase [Nonomuraea spiralis]|uniref:Glycosyltransferase n=1 Tax=Nonomuraea spiralis TaxID=46182 RepID=A0ABV5IGS6_9ACTN|nr:glycosyltransferase [Nonomuraea spiralis]GGS98017.1 glycosyl transferase [Nonomuraea spiralis]